MPPTLIVLSGPTASGKTSLSIRLAQHFQTAIVSADSRQFFREMHIGTAKPTAKELAQAPHYFIDSHSITEGYSVGQYEREALELLQKLYQEHETVILTGGSGLYINALCQGMDQFPEVPEAVRQSVEDDLEKRGIGYLQEELRTADPEYYEEVDLNNPHRLIRALSVCRSSGQPYSRFRKAGAAARFFRPIYLQLHWPRKELYDRINRRVDLMLEDGLEEEARSLYPQKHLTALQTVGYQEFFDYFDGNTSREKAIELIKRNSRRYAKRQLTWFRRDGHWKRFRPSEWGEILRYLELSRKEQLHIQKRRSDSFSQIDLLQAGRLVGRATVDNKAAAAYEVKPPADWAWVLEHETGLENHKVH
ncbi:MAG: tRNA (adenosine(37)-N6)-dimethylallyltransferase MiaA [Bacteroidetes bacterium]|jgi:tRNA dimethylallyltransferase|nr:tRNA (adenosine(37)-N6)-dimethylallyltransferase MiaA [Bacteroidota bacterium]